MAEKSINTQNSSIGTGKVPPISGNTSGTPIEKGGPSRSEPNANIDKLNKILEPVRQVFTNELSVLWVKVITFFCIALGIVIAIIIFYFLIMEGCLKPDFNNATLEISYDIGIRVILISLAISIIAFCLKMMRVYLSLYEQMRYKNAILNSMPYLVYANDDSEFFKSSCNKIIEMLIQLNKDVSIGKEEEVITSSALYEIVKLLKDK